jgi:hypothetical protein
MTTPRSLADDLRGRDDAALETLVRRRPDLALPTPGDLGQLAGRSVTAASTSRALDHLTRFGLQVLEAAVVCDEPFTLPDVQALFPDTAPQEVQDQFDDLVLLALIWGEPDAWHPTISARETVGRFPALALLGGGEPADLVTALDGAPAEVREVVDALTWNNPTGRVRNADRAVTPETAKTPIEWLLARGVLRPLDKGTVVLPREVALHLRGGRLHHEVTTEPPPPDLHHHDPVVIDRLATGAADELVRQVGALLERWGVAPPGVLRSGGLGVRDLRAAATLLDIDEGVASLVIELARAAGLLATSGETPDEWLPTPSYDLWRTRSVAERWTQLADAWLVTPRLASLVGTLGVGESRGRAARGTGHPALGAARPRVVRARDGSERRVSCPST